MSILYPPVLESQRESIASVPLEGVFSIPFTMPLSVDTTKIGHVQILIRRQVNTEPWSKQNRPLSVPEKDVIYLPGTIGTDDPAHVDRKALRDAGGGLWYVDIPPSLIRGITSNGGGDTGLPGFPAGGPNKEGETFTIQIRFGDSPLTYKEVTDFATWKQIQTVNSLFGEWSNTQRVFVYALPAASPDVDISSIFSVSVLNDPVAKLKWSYTPVSLDPLAQVKVSYSWSSPDDYGNSFRSKNVEFKSHDGRGASSAGDINLGVMRFAKLIVVISFITVNNTVYNWVSTDHDEIKAFYFYQEENVKGTIREFPIIGEEIEDGVLAMTFSWDWVEENINTYHNIYRVDATTLETILLNKIEAPLDPALLGSSFTTTIKDYSVEMGAEYLYIAVAFDKNTKSAKHMLVWEEEEYLTPLVWKPHLYSGYAKQVNFQGNIFLTTKWQQLRLQGNVQVGNFQRNTSDQFTTTIGGTHPFYSRSAKFNYRTMSLQAAVSLNFDSTNTFLRFKSSMTTSEMQLHLNNAAKRYQNDVSEYDRDIFLKSKIADRQVRYYSEIRMIYQGIDPVTGKSFIPEGSKPQWMTGQLWLRESQDSERLVLRASELFSEQEISNSIKRVRDDLPIAPPPKIPAPLYLLVNSGLDKTFSIPTQGMLNGLLDHTYNWDIDWGDEVKESFTGIQSIDGISHVYPREDKKYTIKISPTDSKEKGWLRAFGCGKICHGASTASNLNKILQINCLLDEQAVRIEETDTDVCAYMFYNCNGAEFTMGKLFNLPQDVIAIGDNFCQEMFGNCFGDQFTMGENFNLPKKLKTVGNNFADRMFRNCSGENFNMNSIFDMPQMLSYSGDSFCREMFSGCYGTSFTMNSTFNLPKNISIVGHDFISFMFNGCNGEKFNMNSYFNIPSGIVDTKEGFCNSLFRDCYGASFNMNSVFNLPQEILVIGNNFCDFMFFNCSNDIFKMNEVFNLPQKITIAENNFCNSIFANCGGLVFTMNSIFNLPQSLVNVEDNFCTAFFKNCDNAVFTMNSVFNLPQNIALIGNGFCNEVFYNCSKNFVMNEIFNLPQGILVAGNDFCSFIFYNCSNDDFTMNLVFNLPQSLTEVGDNFCSSMFRDCSGEKFKMNLVFNIPEGIITIGNAFCANIFLNCRGYQFNMNAIFSLPPNISIAKNDFCKNFFANCLTENFIINDVFNLPSELISVGDNFCEGIFKNCKEVSFAPNYVFNFPQKITVVGNGFGKNAFSGSYKLSFYDKADFNLPQNIVKIGDDFCREMFKEAYLMSFSPSSIFNIPQGISEVGNSFCEEMFSQCNSEAFNMNSIFNLPQNISVIKNNFCRKMFFNCRSAVFTMNPVFNLPQEVTSVGDSFCEAIFYSCNQVFNMNSIFNLPQKLTRVGDNFCKDAFSDYSSLFTMNEVFTIPQEIKTIGNGFCDSMFSFSNSKNNGIFNMNSVFNLPKNILNAKNKFCYQMFSNCEDNNVFNMNSVFNLPQEIETIGDDFCANMFSPISYASKSMTEEKALEGVFTMNSLFNLPQNVIVVGKRFCSKMFYSCKSAAFNMNEIFNLPRNIVLVGESFCYNMFYSCSGADFNINSIFRLPQNIETVQPNFCAGIFHNCPSSGFENILNFFGNVKYTAEELDKNNVFRNAFLKCVKYQGPALSPLNLPILSVSPTISNQCFGEGFPEDKKINVPIKWK